MMRSFFDNWRKNRRVPRWPDTCALCHAPGCVERALCDACHADLAWLTRSCRHCALALAADSQATICRTCQRDPAFDEAIAACHYDEALSWLIGALKFRGRIAHARVLAELLETRLRALDWAGCDLLLPVPLHPTQFRRRGFNQAERIAHHLGRALDLPVAPDGLRRIRRTRRQSDLRIAARAANVKNAFVCDLDLTGRRVALVDDVITTTRTARAVGQAARAAGAAELICLAPARA